MKFKKKITNHLKGNTIITCTASTAATNVKNEKQYIEINKQICISFKVLDLYFSYNNLYQQY